MGCRATQSEVEREPRVGGASERLLPPKLDLRRPPAREPADPARVPREVSEAGPTTGPLDVTLTLADDAKLPNGVRLEVTVENNSGDDLDVAHAVQVLDVDGQDVVTPLASDIEAVMSSSAGQPHTHDFPQLPDGYYHVLATALADPEQGSATGGAQAFIRVLEESAKVITFEEWWFNSGIESVGGPL
jgi:hypothetical protein